MAKSIEHIKFNNLKRPGYTFDLLKLEELLYREVENDLTVPHKIEFYYIQLITGGTGYHTIDFHDYNYRKGTLLTIRKDQIHRFFKSPTVKGYILIFTEDFLVSHYDQAEVMKAFRLFNELLISPIIQLSPGAYKDILDLIKNIEFEYTEMDDEFSIGIIRSALHILVMKLYRIKSQIAKPYTKNKYLNDFIRLQGLIESNWSVTKKVSDYARLMHCTPKTLNNISQNVIDKSAKVLVDEIVITHIKRLLLNTELSITEVAYASGFEDPTNFYKYFKKHTQLSPERFRHTLN